MATLIKTWFVANNEGSIAGHDMNEYSALCLAADLQEQLPNEEWQALNAEDENGDD
jgi:hypothetical protein